MRIATYNIWNSATDCLLRRKALGEELKRIDADIVALQEVPASAAEDDTLGNAHFVSEHGQYHAAFRGYPEDEEEGLAVLSKSPFLSVEAGWETGIPDLQDCGLRVKLNCHGMAVAVTNVHLDYQSIATRENQILGIAAWIAARAEPGCLEILCGDFNCYPESSVYRFLMGQQTLSGQAGSAAWHDLAAVHACRTGVNPLPTLDFATNPRWVDEAPLALPERCDWVLLQDQWPLQMPNVTNAELFGREPTFEAGIVPSDHYGVLADIQ